MREGRTWQDSERYWQQQEAQALLELATNTYTASHDEDAIWHDTQQQLFDVFCRSRDAHQLKPLSMYCEIIVKRSRGYIHEDIMKSLGVDDPLVYLNLVNRAMVELQQLIDMSAEERTARMQANEGFVLHHSQLKQDMTPLLDPQFNKHIILFPFGALSLIKMTRRNSGRLIGRFETYYYLPGEPRTKKGKTAKVICTTPPLDELTYSLLRETALKFIHKLQERAGEDVAREFFGQAVLDALRTAGGAS
jgi:hypothetical protein